MTESLTQVQQVIEPGPPNNWRTTALRAEAQQLFVHKKGRGPAILLLHGWSHSSEIWDAVMDRLCGTFQLMAPDWPGFGCSRPLETRGPLVDAYAGLLATALRGRGSEGLACLVADSLGAIVALRLGSNETIRCPVVLSGCPAFGLPAGLRLLAVPGLVSLGFRTLHALPPTFAAPLARLAVRFTVNHPTPATATLVKGIMGADPKTAGRLFRELCRPIPRASIPSRLGTRATILRGARDWVAPRGPSLTLAGLLGARYVEVPGASHTPMVEAPRQYAEEIKRTIAPDREV